MKHVKILMLGHCHSVFLQAMSAALKQQGDFHISALELANPGPELRGVEHLSMNASCPHAGRRGSKTKWEVLQALWSNQPIGGWKKTLAQWLGSPDHKSLRAVLGEEYTRGERATKWRRLLPGFDLYHLHYLHTSLTEPVETLPPHAKVVLSIWGSGPVARRPVWTHMHNIMPYANVPI